MKHLKRILIVDDDELLLVMMAEVVENLGYETETAQDGIEALAKINLDIDLVLSDLDMPGMDGLEVIRQIRSDPEVMDVPIIMITSMDTREDKVRAIEAGANDFIGKPVDEMELRVRIASLMKGKEIRDELKRHKAALEKTVEKRTNHLRKALDDMVEAHRSTQSAYQETLQRLAIAAEFKDADTAAHIKRVSEYCTLIAKSIHLPPGEVETIKLAAPMHDVGKIGIPDNILLKPGKYNDEEWVVIKQHPAIGQKLLGGSTNALLKAGEIIAYSHHERWDGTGYPLGLKGEDIPFYGRIISIADVFDALSHERPYKPRFDKDKSLKIMRKYRENLFDPDLLDVFFDNVKEVEHILEQNG